MVIHNQENTHSDLINSNDDIDILCVSLSWSRKILQPGISQHLFSLTLIPYQLDSLQLPGRLWPDCFAFLVDLVLKSGPDLRPVRIL